MRVLVNFMHREGWSVHCLAEDTRTCIGPYINMPEQTTLIKLLSACGLNDHGLADVERDIRAWGRGSVWVDVPDDRKYLLWL